MSEAGTKFDEFHRDNPRVYAKMCEYARQWMATGKTKGSIAMFIELVRWESGIAVTGGDDPWEISNNHKPYYARRMTIWEPDMRGLFELSTAGDPDAWAMEELDRWEEQHGRTWVP